MSARSRLLITLAAATVALTACQKEATGQVAAVVNGEEITLQEINAELGQVSVPEDADRSEVQRAALQRIIDRRLLAQAAKREGIDQSPEFLIRRRQLEDALLVQLLGQQTGRTTSVPEARAIESFMEDNPALFGGRTIFTIDRIQFPMPSEPARLRALENDHSMEAVAARLRGMGIDFVRDRAELDSARLGQARLDQILNLPPGEPFVIPEGNVVTVGVILGSAAQPVGDDQARPAAVQLMRNRALSEAIRQRLEAEKAAADIKYQDGFGPAATTAGGSNSSSRN